MWPPGTDPKISICRPAMASRAPLNFSASSGRAVRAMSSPYAGVPYHHKSRPRAAPTVKRSALRSMREFDAAAPQHEVGHSDCEHQGLPHRDMKSLEPCPVMATDEVERDDANQIRDLENGRARARGDHALPPRRRKRENCRND